ncbi:MULTISPECIES: hypothetical protein [Vagococcus]|uniref:Uncharacterized protein n=1 Tax=Vagococcus fluvialis bH819 TaxID=1255619 RepID=A0A1X6WS66_9ENTE|nr:MULTISPECIES: hypothetical protein [Vagococcus]SLM87107.1 hypothetical protein FM121_13495 [Vagococcus fluvialis bH819]HCM90612.1 hypothetical protein [Vagococcus sp.]
MNYEINAIYRDSVKLRSVKPLFDKFNYGAVLTFVTSEGIELIWKCVSVISTGGFKEIDNINISFKVKEILNDKKIEIWEVSAF